LTSFTEAIVGHRQQTSSARQKVADRYIDCVLDIDVNVMTAENNPRSGNGDYPDTWEQSLEATAQQFGPTAPGVGGEYSSNNMDKPDGSESDIAASVDLDGFNVFPFDDGGNLSIDYEPFGLLLDGL
jgi:hypothetical protein